MVKTSSNKKAEFINPFPGLRPFSIEESHLFFGREGQSEEILDSLEKNKFVAVIGASGSGKSSLIYCGLVPILHGGFVGKMESQWQTIKSRPGNDPINNLAAAIEDNATGKTKDSSGNKNKQEFISTMLRSNSNGLIDVLDSIYSFDNENILIIIDQFEELFRFKETGKDINTLNESAAFVKLLVSAVQDQKNPVYIVITMRSDFIGECSQFHELTELINDSNYLVPQMTREDFREAIKGPVAVGGAEIDSQLVQLLLNEVGDNPDQLPILQHALMRTWEYWKEHSEGSRPISVTDYEAIGKLEKALSDHANEAFDELDEEGKPICESIFKTITEKGNDNRGIRHPASVKKIADIAQTEPDKIIKVINPFREVGRSFVTPAANIKLDENSIIDISHESLMRIWNRLKIWVEEEYNAVQMYLRLSEAAEMYQLGKTGLWRPPDLQLALNWREKQKPTLAWAERYNPAFERAMVYLDTSEKSFKVEEENKIKLQKRTLRRARVFAIVLGSAAIIAVGLTLYSQQLKVQAQEREKEATEQRAIAEEQRQIALEQEELARQKEQEALQQKEEADRQRQIAQVQQEQAERNFNIAEQQRELAVQKQKEADYQKMQAEKNAEEAQRQSEEAERARQEALKRRMLSIAQSMAVKSQQLTDDRQLKGLIAYQGYVFNNENEGDINSPDIYSGLYESLKSLEGQYFNSFKGHTGAVRDLVFMVDSENFYTTGGDGRILKWELGNNQAKLEVAKNDYGNKCLDISSDGKYLICGTDNSIIQVYDVNNNHKLVEELTDHTAAIIDVSFSADDRYFFSVSNDKKLLKWDISTFESELVKEFETKVNVLEICEGKNQLVIATQDGKLLSIDLEDNYNETILFSETRNQVVSIDFSSNSHYCAFGDLKGVLRIMDLNTLKIIDQITGHRSRIVDVDISNNDEFIATASLDGTVKIWDRENLTNQPIEIRDHESWVLTVTFSPDGEQFITTSNQEERILMWYTYSSTIAPLVKEKLIRNMTEDEWDNYVASDIDYRKIIDE